MQLTVGENDNRNNIIGEKRGQNKTFNIKGSVDSSTAGSSRNSLFTLWNVSSEIHKISKTYRTNNKIEDVIPINCTQMVNKVKKPQTF